MDDIKLDELLNHDKRTWDDDVTDAITRMVFTTKAEAPQKALPHRGPHRRGVIVGAVVAGAIALTAGASITGSRTGDPPVPNDRSRHPTSCNSCPGDLHGTERNTGHLPSLHGIPQPG